VVAAATVTEVVAAIEEAADQWIAMAVVDSERVEEVDMGEVSVTAPHLVDAAHDLALCLEAAAAPSLHPRHGVRVGLAQDLAKAVAEAAAAQYPGRG